MKTHKIRYALLVISLISYSCACAQEPANIKFQTLTIDDGLSQGYVNSITQDKKGFMWFATRDGLNRYDGYHFTIYRHKEKDTTSISSNIIYDVFEDSKQRLWVSTFDNGLNYFDRRYQRFYHFFPGIPVGKIREDKNGNLWTKINITQVIRIKVNEMPGAKNNTPGIELDTIQIIFPGSRWGSIYADAAKNIYGITNHAIYKISPGNNRQYFATSIISFNQTSNLSVILEDIKTHKYYIEINDTLFQFSNNHFINPRKIFIQPHSYCFIDGSGRIWFKNLNNKGEYLFTTLINSQTGAIKKINPVNNTDNKFLENMHSAYQDRNGTFWIGTIGFGILKCAEAQNRFNLTLPQSVLYGLAAVKDSGIQIKPNVRLQVNGRKDVLVDSLNIKIKLKLSDFTIDSSGYIWYALPRNQLIQYNPVSGIIVNTISIQDKSNKELNFLIDSLQGIDSTSWSKYSFLNGFYITDNHVWMFLQNLFLSYNTKTKKIVTYPFIKGFNTDIGKVLNYYIDKHGWLWITGFNGCYQMNISTGKTFSYTNERNENRNIASFCDDPLQPEKYIWLGTSNGLYRMEKATGLCINFDKKGLPKSIIYGILSDSLGNLWMSSNSGLYRLHLKDFNVENFTADDGLQGNEFDTYSYLKMKNGLLFFGGLKGLNFFKPEDIMPLAAPSVIITDYKISGISANYGIKNSLLAQDISYTQNITQKFSKSAITIEFAGVDYSKSKKLIYRYKLEGFESDWNYAGINNFATYTNVEPGNYTFYAEASNMQNIWGVANTPLYLDITPLWWQTWLFKIFIAAVIFALGFLLYKYQLRNALRVEKMRNRIASDLHDEIGSTLSTMNIYSKIAQNQLMSRKNIEQSQILLQKINDNAEDAMEAMSDIVWSINTRNDNFENIISRLQDHAIHTLEIKGYTVHFNFKDEAANLKLKMEKRRDFYLIYKEALNNIAKHAHGKNVWINLFEKNHYLTLNIKDDGKGFNKNKIRDNSNGLNNMQERAVTIGGKLTINSSKPGEGTTLTLNFPYK